MDNNINIGLTSYQTVKLEKYYTDSYSVPKFDLMRRFSVENRKFVVPVVIQTHLEDIYVSDILDFRDGLQVFRVDYLLEEAVNHITTTQFNSDLSQMDFEVYSSGFTNDQDDVRVYFNIRIFDKNGDNLGYFRTTGKDLFDVLG